jgi:hypothetical protein
MLLPAASRNDSETGYFIYSRDKPEIQIVGFILGPVRHHHISRRRHNAPEGHRSFNSDHTLLAALLLLLIRSETAQPVHDAQVWIAPQLAWFNITVFWLLCPAFSAPASVLRTLRLKRTK